MGMIIESATIQLLKKKPNRTKSVRELKTGQSYVEAIKDYKNAQAMCCALASATEKRIPGSKFIARKHGEFIYVSRLS